MSNRATSRMSIRPYKAQALMNRESAAKLWTKLETAIEEIYKRNSSALFFEELYRTAYNLVLHKHGDMLYQGVSDSFHGHAQIVCEGMLQAADSNLLSELCVAWEDNKTTISKVKDIVMYMDSTYILNQKLVPVYYKGVSIFRECVIYDPVIREKMRRLLLENILAERNGEIIDTETIKGVLNMLIELGIDGERVYEIEFEELFLSASKSFYREEYLSYSAQFSCPEYIKKVEMRFAEEAKRVNRYLSKTTEPKLRAILNSELVSDHAESLVEMEYSGCRNMMKENQIVHLKGLYELLNRVPICLEYLYSCMGDYVKACGCAIVAHHDNPKDNQPVAFLLSIIHLKNKFDSIVQNCFQNDTKAGVVLKNALEHFLNMDNKSAAFLAVYVDDLMKAGLKGCSDVEAEEKIEQAITVFRHIHDKDVFESYYKTHLSKRLLSKKYSDELEKNVISKLKSECGYQFTGKIEGMFADVRISNTLHDDFFADAEAKRAFSDADIEFDVTVLTSGVWPSTSMTATCVLPPIIQQKCFDPFSAFYVKTHSGRKLTWQMHAGGAEVRGKFGKERRDLGVSTYQMCILMMFNDPDSSGGSPTLSLSHIRNTLQISEPELLRHLLSLCTPKYRVLMKSSKGKGIAEGDTFSVNFGFTSKLRRVKIPLVSMKDVNASGAKASGFAQGENFDQLPANVLEDRRHIIEAAIVRIMKARKVLSHNDLIAEVLRQVSHRFSVEVPALKKRIEALIDREYIMRDPEDRKTYKYLA